MTARRPVPAPHPRTLAWLARRLERALTRQELSLSEYRLLCVIADDSAGPSDLAGMLAVSKPRITALADRLAAKGYLERQHRPDDRRRVEHVLTESGRAAVQSADQAASEPLDRILAQLSPEEVAVVENALDLMGRALRDTRSTVRSSP